MTYFPTYKSSQKSFMLQNGSTLGWKTQKNRNEKKRASKR